ncbi:MAG TPA: magnesium protoporphyrin IX methyltransferase [Steroidobacteraceae bacterium]|nr:magnesium protoporphyrin IX methyltransferase [Steroidobacteraceae bacterium]
MSSTTYDIRRSELRAYFDSSAYEAWARLTSDSPVSRIRATVRAGRARMRQLLLDWLPADLSGVRLLDAGCGTGALALEAAARGAEVVAVDVSPMLVRLAVERHPSQASPGRVTFCVGDMLDDSLGSFDYVVAMDSLIHYETADVVAAVSRLARRTRCGILFTFAPRTPALTLMHAVGRMFPRGSRAPAIAPISETCLSDRLTGDAALVEWELQRSMRIHEGFYTSQAQELVHR